AHDNSAFAAILWDMEAGAQVQAAALIGAEALARITPRFCAALDAQRQANRGEPVRRDESDPHTACPSLGNQVLVPIDKDVNGRFDHLEVMTPPYAAGPYAEGDYIVQLPFEPRDLSGVPPRYRAAFEAPQTAGEDALSTDAIEEACRELLREPWTSCSSRVTDIYSFAVAWTAEAAAIPALEALLHEESERSEQWMRQEAEVATAEREAAGAEPMRFTYRETWTVDAQRPELVAASSSAQAYTGGAHEGIAYRVILLDRRSGRRLALGDLFTDPAAGLAAVQASFCPSLQREVRTRRSAEAHVQCPAAAEHPVTLIGGGDGRIGAMKALLNPYVVGGWAEGPYEVQFPVTAEMLAALKTEYRAAFAPPAE
nr:hypothetical protein [Pseudomonadota bacterium]